jgi:hypothetical protein
MNGMRRKALPQRPGGEPPVEQIGCWRVQSSGPKGSATRDDVAEVGARRETDEQISCRRRSVADRCGNHGGGIEPRQCPAKRQTGSASGAPRDGATADGGATSSDGTTADGRPTSGYGAPAYGSAAPSDEDSAYGSAAHASGATSDGSAARCGAEAYGHAAVSEAVGRPSRAAAPDGALGTTASGRRTAHRTPTDRNPAACNVTPRSASRCASCDRPHGSRKSGGQRRAPGRAPSRAATP